MNRKPVALLWSAIFKSAGVEVKDSRYGLPSTGR
jgi:hypothetical protein